MRLSSLLYFYRLRLRTRWVQELFALVGIACGVALLFAAQVANTSLTGSVEQLVRATIGQAELAVTARTAEGFDESVADRVREVPGVKVAAPLLEVRATVSHEGHRAPVTILGADRRLTGMGGALLSQLRDAPVTDASFIGLPTPIVRRLDLTVGGTVLMEAGGKATRTRVGVSLGERELGGLVQSPIAVATLGYAQRLGALPDRITRVLVLPEPGEGVGVERALERIAGTTLDVRPAGYDIDLLSQAAGPSNQSTAMFAVISAMVGFLFAFNAMLLTLGDRRRLIAALRDDGYSPLAICQVVLFDALVLGCTASLVGLALGDFLSRALFDVAPGYLSLAFAVGDQRIVEWQTIALSLTAGIAAALLPTLIPLRQLLGPPRDDVDTPGSGITARQTRIACAAGLVALALSLVLPASSPTAAIAALVLLGGALMLILPGIILGVIAVADRLLVRVRSPIPLLSLGELRAMPARSLAVAATGALAVFGSVASQGARSDLQAGLDRSTHDLNAVADLWVAPPGQANILATEPFHHSDGETLRALPEVRAVGVFRSGFLDYGDRRVWVLAQPDGSPRPVPPTQLVEGDVDVATSRLSTGGWAVISDGIAAAHGLAIGDRFSLPAAQPRTFRVAALSTNVGWPPGSIVINSDDFREAWGSDAPSAFQVTLADGVSPARGRRAVAAALGPASALTVETTPEREARHRATSREALSRLDQLSVLLLIAAVLALAAATGGMVWQRRQRIATVKLDGFRDGTVWGALLFESGLLLGAGCLAGAAFGLCGQQLLDHALVTVTGFPVVRSIGIGVALASFALVTAVAVVVAGLPGYLAARVSPTTALQD